MKITPEEAGHLARQLEHYVLLPIAREPGALGDPEDPAVQRIHARADKVRGRINELRQFADEGEVTTQVDEEKRSSNFTSPHWRG